MAKETEGMTAKVVTEDLLLAKVVTIDILLAKAVTEDILMAKVVSEDIMAMVDVLAMMGNATEVLMAKETEVLMAKVVTEDLLLAKVVVAILTLLVVRKRTTVLMQVFPASLLLASRKKSIHPVSFVS